MKENTRGRKTQEIQRLLIKDSWQLKAAESRQTEVFYSPLCNLLINQLINLENSLHYPLLVLKHFIVPLSCYPEINFSVHNLHCHFNAIRFMFTVLAWVRYFSFPVFYFIYLSLFKISKPEWVCVFSLRWFLLFHVFLHFFVHLLFTDFLKIIFKHKTLSAMMMLLKKLQYSNFLFFSALL